MSKIESAQGYDIPGAETTRQPAPSGAGIILAVGVGTLFWAGIILAFV